MKKLIIFFFLVVSASYSQTSDALKLCVALQDNFTSNTEANNAVDKILSVIGTSQKPILQPCSNINNAVAASYKGQRYILYDKVFMESLTVGRNKYWSNMFILAHEVGHHINGHSLDIILYQNDVINPKSLSTRRSQELEADEFAGFVLAKLGATFNQTSKVLLNIPKISNDYDSTHPSRDKRIRAVKNGWERGYVKKETKTVYVSDAIGEYERSDSYVRHGKWYREQNDDVFEGRTWTAVTSGILKGGNDYFNRAPVIKINNKNEKYNIFIEGNIFNKLPQWINLRGDFIVLDSKNKEIYRSGFMVSSDIDKDGFYPFYTGESPIKYFQEGIKLLIRFDDYNRAVYKDEIKKYAFDRSLFRITNYGFGAGETKLYFKLQKQKNTIFLFDRVGLNTYSARKVSKDNYNNRLFASKEIIDEIDKLKVIDAACRFSSKSTYVHSVTYTNKLNTEFKKRISDKTQWSGTCNISKSEYDTKVDAVLNKLIDFNSEIFALKNQLIEVKGAYFEYSLSGSSKALAE